MAKMHFKYASMNSGKSIDLIRTAYNYEENGYNVLVTKPKIDTKSGNKISCRIGLERKADVLFDLDSSIYDDFKDKLLNINCIFVDEAQFLTRNQVDELFTISKVMDIPVICYGLRTDFMMEAFEGSKRLLEISDVLEELTTLCSCGSIARYNARIINNEYVSTGEKIVIDNSDDVKYVPLCGDCYLKKVKKLDYNKIKRNLGNVDD